MITVLVPYSTTLHVEALLKRPSNAVQALLNGPVMFLLLSLLLHSSNLHTYDGERSAEVQACPLLRQTYSRSNLLIDPQGKLWPHSLVSSKDTLSSKNNSMKS